MKNTEKITRAMKLVAAAMLRRAQGAMMELRPYAEKYREMLGSLVAATGGEGEAAHALFEPREEIKTVAVVAMSSDRGMCGAFNNAAQKQLSIYVASQEAAGRNVLVFPLGRRIGQFVNKRSFEVGENLGFIVPSAETGPIKKITAMLVDGFLEGTYDEVVIISNRFRSVIAQEAMTSPLLPVVAEEEDETKERGDFLYEPDQESLLDHVVPAYVEVQVREAILESIAGEHAARMNAMHSATDNASEMISSLTLQMNRARQAAITTELMEIIGGAEALK